MTKRNCKKNSKSEKLKTERSMRGNSGLEC